MTAPLLAAAPRIHPGRQPDDQDPASPLRLHHHAVHRSPRPGPVRLRRTSPSRARVTMTWLLRPEVWVKALVTCWARRVSQINLIRQSVFMDDCTGPNYAIFRYRKIVGDTAIRANE